VISVALKTPLQIRLGICIYKSSLLHRPDEYIGFTLSCPPTFYNKFAPMVTTQYYCLLLNVRITILAFHPRSAVSRGLALLRAFCFVSVRLNIKYESHQVAGREQDAGRLYGSGYKKIMKKKEQEIRNALNLKKKQNCNWMFCLW